jgi:hypothetical protein
MIIFSFINYKLTNTKKSNFCFFTFHMQKFYYLFRMTLATLRSEWQTIGVSIDFYLSFNTNPGSLLVRRGYLFFQIISQASFYLL